MQKGVKNETRQVSAEEVAKAFGINVQQLNYKVAMGEQLGMTSYVRVPLYKRIWNAIKTLSHC